MPDCIGNFTITKKHTTMNAAAPQEQQHCKNKDNNNINKNDENQLLTGLPNHLTERCLSNLQPSLLYRVCKSWRNHIYSPSFPPFFSLYALLYQTSSTETSLTCPRGQCQQSSIAFSCFDPIAHTWRNIPNPPSDKPLCIQRKHPSYISRILPIQSLSVSGRLVLIAATTHQFLPALDCPLIFNPLSSKWYYGPPLSAPRRWCVAGSMHGSIYVSSGAGAKYQGDVARSIEKWDMSKNNVDWNWEKMASFKDGRFSREAVEAIGYRGKLCMVNVKGRASKEGAIYDALMNRWEEMPRGMVAGWNGPATVDDRDEMYVVDQELGSLSRYDTENDCWGELIEGCEYLKGAEQISAFCGKVCVAFGDGLKIVVADIVTTPVKIWVVDPPQGMEAIAVHILPRMSFPE